MIRSFRHKGLRRFFEDDDRLGIPPEDADKIARILARLDAAARPEDREAPGFRLHSLKGNLKGFWAVSVRANWGVIFRFRDGEATEVDHVDYH